MRKPARESSPVSPNTNEVSASGMGGDVVEVLTGDSVVSGGQGPTQSVEAQGSEESCGETLLVELDAKDEDVEPARRPPLMYQPPAAELEEHRIDHIPYRNWCPWCVRGKSDGE